MGDGYTERKKMSSTVKKKLLVAGSVASAASASARGRKRSTATAARKTVKKRYSIFFFLVCFYRFVIQCRELNIGRHTTIKTFLIDSILMPIYKARFYSTFDVEDQ